MRVIKIDTTVLSGGASPDTEKLALLIAQDGKAGDGTLVLAPDGADRYRRYSSSGAVATDFGATSKVGLAAGAYFRQGIPSDLLIGRWNENAEDARSYGGAPTGVPGAGVLGQTSAVAVDGADVDVDFVAADDTEAEIADRLETALAAEVAGTTVTYNSTRKRYEITWGAASHTIGEASADDAAVALGLDDSVAGFFELDSTMDEDLADAATALQTLSGLWRWVTVAYGDSTADDTANAKDLITWAANQTPTEIQAVVEGRDASEAAAVDANSVSRAASDASSDNVACIVTKTLQNKAMSVIGSMSGVNYQAADSVRTAALQSLNGCSPDSWTDTEIARLDAKRANYYVEEHGVGIVFPGVTTGTDWEYIDTAAWINWFQGSLGLELFNEIRRRRVPQSDEGLARLSSAMGRSAELGVLNGGIAENTQLGTAATQTQRRLANDPDLTGLLPQGYEIYTGPLSQRQGRKTPPLYLLTRYTGAFHEADVQLIVET